jgi:Fe-S cluster assembly ATPase SufC
LIVYNQGLFVNIIPQEIFMSEMIIQDLHVNVGGKEILKGVNLTVKQGEVHALMGPNGTGKSTLAYTLMGHPGYQVTQGKVFFKGVNILELKADERSRLGLFLAFQYPVAISGVSVANFLRTAINARRKSENSSDKGISVPEFRKVLKERMEMLKMDYAFARRLRATPAWLRPRRVSQRHNRERRSSSRKITPRIPPSGPNGRMSVAALPS